MEVKVKTEPVPSGGGCKLNNCMTCVWVTCESNELEAVLVAAATVDAELAGVEEAGDGRLRLWLAESEDAGELCRLLDPWCPVVERVEDRNWNEPWQSQWQPVEIGERFFLVPPGDPAPTPKDRIRLAMHPGTAFGNGDHPTTHLCLLAMERELCQGDVFLDIGCASGLLGEAARALGAGCVIGCDLDAAAVRRDAFIGSVTAVRTASCDFVVANIQLGVLIEILPEIARVMRPGARGLLSGILPAQTEPLRRAIAQCGLQPGPAALLDGWMSIGVGAAAG